MRITQVLVLALVGTALSTQFAVADADGERAALARINHELEAIESLITEAAGLEINTNTANSIPASMSMILAPMSMN